MRRSLWFAAGASAGVYAAARARRAAEVFTIDGLRDRVGAAVLGARMLRAEVAQGKAEAETELRERINLGLDERRELMARPRGDDDVPHRGPDVSDHLAKHASQSKQDNQNNQEEGTS
ncbi:MAG: DUF6167 family protein [Nocardioides sp.]